MKMPKEIYMRDDDWGGVELTSPNDHRARKYVLQEEKNYLYEAASDLYEALQSLLFGYGWTDYPSAQERDSDPDVIAAREALAKARGEL